MIKIVVVRAFLIERFLKQSCEAVAQVRGTSGPDSEQRQSVLLPYTSARTDLNVPFSSYGTTHQPAASRLIEGYLPRRGNQDRVRGL